MNTCILVKIHYGISCKSSTKLVKKKKATLIPRSTLGRAGRHSRASCLQQQGSGACNSQTGTNESVSGLQSTGLTTRGRAGVVGSLHGSGNGSGNEDLGELHFWGEYSFTVSLLQWMEKWTLFMSRRKSTPAPLPPNNVLLPRAVH